MFCTLFHPDVQTMDKNLPKRQLVHGSSQDGSSPAQEPFLKKARILEDVLNAAKETKFEHEEILPSKEPTEQRDSSNRGVADSKDCEHSEHGIENTTIMKDINSMEVNIANILSSIGEESAEEDAPSNMPVSDISSIPRAEIQVCSPSRVGVVSIKTETDLQVGDETQKEAQGGKIIDTAPEDNALVKESPKNVCASHLLLTNESANISYYENKPTSSHNIQKDAVFQSTYGKHTNVHSDIHIAESVNKECARSTHGDGQIGNEPDKCAKIHLKTDKRILEPKEPRGMPAWPEKSQQKADILLDILSLGKTTDKVSDVHQSLSTITHTSKKRKQSDPQRSLIHQDFALEKNIKQEVPCSRETVNEVHFEQAHKTAELQTGFSQTQKSYDSACPGQADEENGEKTRILQSVSLVEKSTLKSLPSSSASPLSQACSSSAEIKVENTQDVRKSTREKPVIARFTSPESNGKTKTGKSTSSRKQSRKGKPSRIVFRQIVSHKKEPEEIPEKIPDSDNTTNPPPLRKRASYDAAFKLEVVFKAEQIGSFRKAAALYGINEKQVREWTRTKVFLSNNLTSGKKRLPGGGRKVRFDELEMKLTEWVESEKSKGRPISGVDLQIQARNFSPDLDFKASNGWLQRFKARHGLSKTRAKSKSRQKPSKESEEQVLNFYCYYRSFIMQLFEKHKYEPSDIFNVDETLLKVDSFEVGNNESALSKDLPPKNAGAEKSGLAAILTVAANGTNNLQIFMGDKMPVEKVQGMNLVTHNQNFIEEETVLTWLESTFPRNKASKRCLLIWDSNPAHLTAKVQEELEQRHIDVAVIPESIAPFLQPIDVCLKQPLGKRIRSLFQDWLQNGGKTNLESKQNFPPSQDILRDWILQSWTNIPSNLITDSFKKCGVTIKLDGSEDGLVYEHVVRSMEARMDIDTSSWENSHLLLPKAINTGEDVKVKKETEYGGMEVAQKEEGEKKEEKQSDCNKMPEVKEEIEQSDK